MLSKDLMWNRILEKRPKDAAKLLIDEAAKGFAMSMKAAQVAGVMSLEDAENFALMALQFYELLLVDMSEEEFTKYMGCQNG